MPYRFRIRALLALCVACGPAAVVQTAFAVVLAAPVAQAQACLGRDDNSAFMLANLKQLVSSTNPQDGFQRRDLKIPVVDTATVVLVSDPQTCARVLTAFLSTLPADYPTPLPTERLRSSGRTCVRRHAPASTGRNWLALRRCRLNIQGALEVRL